MTATGKMKEALELHFGTAEASDRRHLAIMRMWVAVTGTRRLLVTWSFAEIHTSVLY